MKKSNPFPSVSVFVVSLAMLGFAGLGSGEDFEIVRSTIDGGGVMRGTSADGVLELSGTIGQPDAGMMASADGSLEMFGGFWFPLASGDCDEDGGVTLSDFVQKVDCLEGPDGAASEGCTCFDLDRNGVVDMHDLAMFLNGFSGS